MIALRLLSLLAGGLVLIVPPILVFGDIGGNVSGGIAVGAAACLGLIALAFIYVAVNGRRMRRGGRARTIGGALLAIPALASLAMLAIRTDEGTLWASGVMLVFTMLLFFSFVYPATAGKRQRPMRERERQEHVAFLHHHN